MTADPWDPTAEVEVRVAAAVEAQAIALDLSGLGLTTLPDDLDTRLPGLQTLDLGRNRLVELPERRRTRLTELEELSISDNRGYARAAARTPSRLGKLMRLDVAARTKSSSFRMRWVR